MGNLFDNGEVGVSLVGDQALAGSIPSANVEVLFPVDTLSHDLHTATGATLVVLFPDDAADKSAPLLLNDSPTVPLSTPKQAEQNSLNNKISGYQWWPVMGVGLMYRFW